MPTTRLKAKNPKQAKPSKPKILIYSQPKIGKTWFALDFPNVYYIDVEGGANLPHYTDKLKESKGVYFGVEDGSMDPAEIIGQVRALATEDHNHQTLVIDSISKIYNSIITREAERLGDKDAFGASKKPAIQFIRSLVSWIDKIDMNVILVAHEKLTWSNGEQGPPTFDAHEKLGYELSLLFRADKRGNSRVLITKYSRYTQFEEGDTIPLTYNDFAEKFGRDVVERKSEKIELASKEQIAEVARLLEIVKVDPADIEKGFAKAQVDDWSEMTVSQINTWIEFLNKKISPVTQPENKK